ncbi:SAM-dependent DNA methyltransferase [bacterium]|nr:SAM-dependent DNA methyltransferase [bacterium]
MESQGRAMLEGMYALIFEKFNDPIKAWDSFIEFLAVDNCASLLPQLSHNFEWLFEDRRLTEKLAKLHNPQVLQSDYYDHLGDMYMEKVLTKKQNGKQGQFLTTGQTSDSIVKMTIDKTDKPMKIYDSSVGTGRMLMGAAKNAPDGIFYGVDSDLRVLRIAFTNMALYNISGYLLHADSSKHAVDISTLEGRYNWQFANHWDSQMDKLKPIQFTNPLPPILNDQTDLNVK